jgi:hypothetical protein
MDPVADGKKKALAASKANATSALALECLSGFRSEALSSRESPQPSVSQRKADELSSSDSLSEPVSCPAPRHLFGDRPVAQGYTGKLAAKSNRQLRPSKGGLVYDALVAQHTSLQQLSGRHETPAKGSDLSEPTTSTEAATRCISLRDVSGPLCGMPDGTTLSTQVTTNCRTHR